MLGTLVVWVGGGGGGGFGLRVGISQGCPLPVRIPGQTSA